MDDYLRILIATAEENYRSFIARRCTDTNSIYHGGNIGPIGKLTSPKSTLTSVGDMIALYYYPQSLYYKNEKLYEIMLDAISCVERLQREDGTFDNPESNFYAAPNTGFMINRIIPAYRIAATNNDTEVISRLKQIFYKAGLGIVAGGFHTPNHRWANASSLMFLSNLFQNESFRAKAMEYLREGIDIDQDGDFAERSAAKYNVVNDLMMMVLYEETNDSIYLDIMEKNLDMMRYYMEPDGSIFTGSSTRIDRLNKSYPDEYFFLYLYVGRIKNRHDYIAIACEIFDNMLARGDRYPEPNCMPYLVNNPKLLKGGRGEGCIPINYEKLLNATGVLRIRRGNYSTTLIRNNSKVLLFNSGTLSVFMRIGVSYFNKREFLGNEIIKCNDGYATEFSAKSWYYLPFEKVPDTTDWWAMDNKSRKQIGGHDVNLRLTVNEIENGISINLSSWGCDRVPVKIEFGISKNCIMETENMYINGSEVDAITLKSGTLKISSGSDLICIGPAFANHNFVEGNQKSEPRSDKATTVYFTSFTNMNHTFSIIAGQGGGIIDE